jgi:hypothetical protein
MHNPNRRLVSRARRGLIVVTLAAIVMTLVASPASAASVRRTWTAHLGGNGANGTATLTAYFAGNGLLRLALVGLEPSTTYRVIAYRGTCAKPSVTTTLPSATTDASGVVATVSALSTTTMDAIWRYGRTASFSIRVGTGALARCGGLTFAVATRIAIPSLGIDLPVVRPPSGYPLCNVGMYIRELSQPREAGVTLLYAHARRGMFLPLLTRSKVNNGASLIGATVKVWMSSDLVYSYEITRVRRHVRTLDGVVGIGPEQLWIQTSEGPRGTVGKLIVVAKRTGSQASSHASAHPAPHPVVCH